MYDGKPIIGLSGGIGSGKTFVGRLFADAGCVVISSDELVRQAYHDSGVKQTLREWWGDAVFAPDGEIDRSAVSSRVFDREFERRRLEGILHPMIAQARLRIMQNAAAEGQTVAFVWDTPLLFETQLNRLCDVTIFVDAPVEVRLARVRQSRGWDSDELARRENSQMPLDKKRKMSNYVVVNTADAESARGQVQELLSRILAGSSPSLIND